MNAIACRRYGPLFCSKTYFCLMQAFVLTLVLIPGNVRAQSGQRPAGYVTAVDAPEQDGKPGVVIRRAGQEIEVQIWTPLFNGDVLEVSGPAKVVIETVKDKRATIDAAHSPHTIEGALAGDGKMSEISSLIGDLFRSKPTRDAVNLIGRSDPSPRMRLGEGAMQRVIAGKPVWLAWQGGNPPYTIEVRGQTAMRKHDIGVLAQAVAPMREATIDIPPTASGRLTLVIRDSAGLEFHKPVETGAAPPIPTWVSAGAPTGEFATVAEALFLLTQNKGAYDLLAATRAATVKDYPPARELLRQLAEGRRPQ